MKFRTPIGELLLVLEESIKSINDARLFQKTFLDLKIPKKLILEIFNKHLEIIKKEFEQHDNNNQNSSSFTCLKEAVLKKSASGINEEKCSLTSPICLKTLEKNKQRKKKESFLIYRQGFSPHIIPNYFQKFYNENNQCFVEQLTNSFEFEAVKLMQKPDNKAVIGRFNHVCFEKQLTSRQNRKKIDVLENKTNSNDSFILSPDFLENKKKEDKGIRASSLHKKKSNNESLNGKQNKKFSQKVNKSKDFLVSLFKGSFCMNNQRDYTTNNNIEIKPRVLDFDSFLARNKKIPVQTESFVVDNAQNNNEFLTHRKNQEEKNPNAELFYENGLGITGISPLLESHLYEKFKEQLDRSNSISFNKKFLGGS